MKVRYTSRAFAERERIFSYLDERNPAAASKIVGRIIRRIRTLEHNPYSGRRTDRGDLYTFWVAATTYRVYYRIDDSSHVTTAMAWRRVAEYAVGSCHSPGEAA
jgi:plasmid stabilization system protein ParE